jgi:hypothetical protein
MIEAIPEVAYRKLSGPRPDQLRGRWIRCWIAAITAHRSDAVTTRPGGYAFPQRRVPSLSSETKS